MIIANNKKVESLNSILSNDLYIVTDFDGTITTENSDSSWASIFKNPKVNEEFVAECVKIYKKYHRFEIDDTLPVSKKMLLMNEWYKKNIKTLIKFKITDSIIDYAANNVNIMKFRDGALDFLKNMYEKNIPIIIISAGVGNIIERFLINNKCNYSNIYICSNFLEYKNGQVIGVRDNNLIHPLNKNEVYLPNCIKSKIIDRNNVLLLGNSVLDTNMVDSSKNVYKLGFLDEFTKEKLELFKSSYDIVCINNTNFKDIQQLLTVLK